jgi:hypothetical protein
MVIHLNAVLILLLLRSVLVTLFSFGDLLCEGDISDETASLQSLTQTFTDRKSSSMRKAVTWKREDERRKRPKLFRFCLFCRIFWDREIQRLRGCLLLCQVRHQPGKKRSISLEILLVLLYLPEHPCFLLRINKEDMTLPFFFLFFHATLLRKRSSYQ